MKQKLRVVPRIAQALRMFPEISASSWVLSSSQISGTNDTYMVLFYLLIIRALWVNY